MKTQTIHRPVLGLPAPAAPRASTGFDIIVGNYIRDARREAGVSQTSLGETVGVTFQQIQKYERGSNRVTVERFVKICRALDISSTEALADILDLSWRTSQ